MLYLAMGWLVVLDYENVMQVFSQPALHYLILEVFSLALAPFFTAGKAGIIIGMALMGACRCFCPLSNGAYYS